MGKIQQKDLKPTLLPIPPVLTSVGDRELTIAWTGVLAMEPPLIGLSLRRTYAAYPILRETMEYVANVPTAKIMENFDRVDMAGEKPGDKFQISGLTSLKATQVRPPLVKECPVNLECRVTQIITLGSHDLFVGEVVASHFDSEVVNDRGELIIEKFEPFAFCPGSGQFWTLGRPEGYVGMTKGKKYLY